MICDLFLSQNIKLYIILTSFANMQIIKSTQKPISIFKLWNMDIFDTEIGLFDT